MLLDLQVVPFVAITDHCALKYFIIKQLLNSQQTKWVNIVTDYNFKIAYCSGTANIVADALTRKHGELITQKENDIAAWTQLFLNSSYVVAAISEGSMNVKSDLMNNEQGSSNEAERAESSYQLVNQILQVNCSHKSLKHYQQMTRKEKQGWTLQDDLLTQFEKLMMSEVNALRTHLINEAHSTPVTAHSEKTKIAKLLSVQYYWPGLSNDCSTFVLNC